MKTTFICLVVMIFTSFSLIAQDDADYLVYRQKLMKSNGLHMSLIGDIFKKNLPFKNQINSHAKGVQLNNLLIKDAYKKRITQGKTDSKPDVWNNWQEFVMAAKESAAAAEKLSNAPINDIQMQLKAVGMTCGGCHKKFRKPKGERFAR